VALAPITPVRDTAGNLYDRPTTTYYNSLVDYENGEWMSTTFRNLATLYGQYNFTKNFFLRSEYSLDLLTQNDDEFYGSRTLYGGATNGYGISTWFRTTNQNINNYFNYSNQFADKHDVDATLGMSLQKVRTDYSQLTGEDFPVDALKNLASAGKITGGTSTETNFSFLSYFARVNYKLNDRYLLSLSGRIDGSSRFGKNTRYGFFPAVSAGWILTEEDFLKDAGIISFLKLRASYGYTGNAEIGDFPQLGLWNASKYNQSSGLSPTQLANPDLKWEKSQQTDIGIDFGLFNNRLSGELDYYVRNTTDLLYNLPVPMTTGFTTILANVGSMQNKGFEIVLNSINVNSRDFRWTTSLNFSRNYNKITKLDGDTDTLPGNDGRYLNSMIVGEPIGVFYGPKYAGVDPTNGDGLYYMEDGKTTTNDYNEAGNFIVGNPNPDFFYGFSNNFSYKGFELDVLFQGVHGNDIMNGAGGFMSGNGDWFDNQTRDQLARWQKPGDITMVPQARLNWTGGIPNAIAASSRYIEDGSYLRLKTISFGYNVPEQFIRRFKLTNLRVYVLGQNLATWTNYSGWDPEVNTDYRSGNRNQGGDFYAAPQIKTITFGINIGL
jgi:TonB-linked SusC/RagA family outer membrane protein